MPTQAPGRREEYAAGTHAALILAGRVLFAERGFFSVRVDEIANRARVAPATVYTSVGGKHAILLELIEQLASWQPRERTFETIARASSRHTVLAALALGTRDTREQWGDVMRLITETAPHDAEVGRAQQARITRYRQALEVVVARLRATEGLPLDQDRTFEVLWFYFGPTAYVPLHDDLGWSYDHAAEWLLEQCEQALGVNRPGAG